MTKNRGEWFAKARAAKATSSEPPASDPVTPEEYGLRAAKRQLKKDNASLVEQNLALRSKVSVLADALAASQEKERIANDRAEAAEERERVWRDAVALVAENAENGQKRTTGEAFTYEQGRRQAAIEIYERADRALTEVVA